MAGIPCRCDTLSHIVIQLRSMGTVLCHNYFAIISGEKVKIINASGVGPQWCGMTINGLLCLRIVCAKNEIEMLR